MEQHQDLRLTLEEAKQLITPNEENVGHSGLPTSWVPHQTIDPSLRWALRDFSGMLIVDPSHLPTKETRKLMQGVRIKSWTYPDMYMFTKQHQDVMESLHEVGKSTTYIAKALRTYRCLVEYNLQHLKVSSDLEKHGSRLDEVESRLDKHAGLLDGILKLVKKWSFSYGK